MLLAAFAVAQSPGSLTSSLVDDVFFILKKCGARALSTGSVQCAAALLGEVNDLLANQLRGALAGRLAGGPARLLAAIGSSKEEGALRRDSRVSTICLLALSQFRTKRSSISVDKHAHCCF